MAIPDLFIGTWVMDVTQNNYQQGTPPAEGIYIIAAHETGYRVTMKWTDVTGKSFEMTYEALPDGKEYPTDTPGVDRVSMTRVDEKTLDSAAFIGETRVAYARRVLSDDGQTMEITQSGTTPDGDDFANVSVYTRQA